jgi:hypothetical protein
VRYTAKMGRTGRVCALFVVGLLVEARLRKCKRLPEAYTLTDENGTNLYFYKPLEIVSA